MKMCSHVIGDYHDEPSAETKLFLSPYGWDVPQELMDVIERHESAAKDYRPFTDLEIMLAGSSPLPIITNPMSSPLVKYLKNDLNLQEWNATEICHDLWYFEMHKEDDGFEDDPGEYFREEVLCDYDASDDIFRKGMRLLDDYLNNMPHWQLKGHTPTETMDMLNKEE